MHIKSNISNFYTETGNKVSNYVVFCPSQKILASFMPEDKMIRQACAILLLSVDQVYGFLIHS